MASSGEELRPLAVLCPYSRVSDANKIPLGNEILRQTFARPNVISVVLADIVTLRAGSIWLEAIERSGPRPSMRHGYPTSGSGHQRIVTQTYYRWSSRCRRPEFAADAADGSP